MVQELDWYMFFVKVEVVWNWTGICSQVDLCIDCVEVVLLCGIELVYALKLHQCKVFPAGIGLGDNFYVLYQCIDSFSC